MHTHGYASRSCSCSLPSGGVVFFHVHNSLARCRDLYSASNFLVLAIAIYKVAHALKMAKYEFIFFKEFICFIYSWICIRFGVPIRRSKNDDRANANRSNTDRALADLQLRVWVQSEVSVSCAFHKKEMLMFLRACLRMYVWDIWNIYIYIYIYICVCVCVCM